MTLFNKKQGLKEGSFVAIFDIASASVGGLLFKYHKNGIPEIVNCVRKPADFPLDNGFKPIWRSLHQAFKNVNDHLIKNVNKKPEIAFCIFSSPWYISQTRIIKVKRDKSFMISKDLIKNLLEDEMNSFKKLWQKSPLSPKGKSIVLEKALLKSVINGYSIKNPVSLSAENLDIFCFLSLGLKEMEEKIKEDILNYIKPNNIHFHSFSFTLFSILKNLINTEEGFMFLDITGELTDIFLIRNGIIEESNCFSRGENFLIRRLASAFNIDMAEARSIMTQYQRKELENSNSEKISTILKPAGEEWARSLKKMFEEMAQEKPLPHHLYFCGPSSTIKEIKEPIATQNFTTLTTLNTTFLIKHFNPEALINHFNFDKGFSTSKDIFLLIETLFSENILKNNTKNA